MGSRNPIYSSNFCQMVHRSRILVWLIIGPNIQSILDWFWLKHLFHLCFYRILRNGSFSEAATLFYGTGEQAVYHLYTKNTHKQFSYSAMIIMLIINFLLSCYTAGTFLSCGIVVPMLLIGGREWNRIFEKGYLNVGRNRKFIM